MDFDNFKTKALEFKDKAVDGAVKAKDKAVDMKDKAVEMKDKAVDMKDKTVELKDNAVEKTTDTINSGKEKIELEKIIKKSKTTTFKNKETGEIKEYIHKSIAVFADQESEFYKKSTYLMPVIITKAFSQNISVKLFKSKINGVNLQDYKVDETKLPSMVIFEKENVLKVIEGEEKILKLVKSFSLDINKQIDEA